MDTGHKIAGLLAARKLRAADLARLTGLSKEAVRMVLAGDRNMSTKTLVGVAKALDVTVDYLAQSRATDPTDFQKVAIEESFRRLGQDLALDPSESLQLWDLASQLPLPPPDTSREWQIIYETLRLRLGPRLAS